VLDNYSAAPLLLERRAKGDYEPDDLLKSFPTFAPEGTKPDGLTPWELFETWVKFKEPAQSTIESWRTVFNALMRDFPDRSASAIQPDEAQRWLDGLRTDERSAFTVRNTWLRATRTVFAWGARRKLTGNPFGEAVVDVPRKKQLRPKWFNEEERTTILEAAAAVVKIDSPDEAARRWVPWLLAYTGARPQDIAQLRGKDVQEVENIWTINVTPEAGTVKNAKARRVPLHEHLIEQGFLDFVASQGVGPLFYRARRTQPSNIDPTKEPKAPAAQVRQRLAAWVRKIGVDDENLSPNHAWRHTFKHIGHRGHISERLLDYICGHAPATV
jgi:integrase